MQVRTIVAAAGRIASPPSDLIQAMKQRLLDTNRNLAATAAHVLASICAACGGAFDRQAHIVLEPTVRNLGDNKKPVRDASIALLDKLLEAGCGKSVFMEIADGMKGLKVEAGKIETIQWIGSKVEGP